MNKTTDNPGAPAAIFPHVEIENGERLWTAYLSDVAGDNDDGLPSTITIKQIGATGAPVNSVTYTREQ